jgi:hypothetical protein
VTFQRRPGAERTRAGKRPTSVSYDEAGGKQYGHRPDYQRSFEANDHSSWLTPVREGLRY